MALAKNALLKEEIIGRLIKPTNPSDLKFAEEEMTNFFEQAAFKQYKNKRTELINAANAPKDGDKTYFKFPWKTYETPVTQGDRDAQAFVQGVVNQNEQISIGDDVFEKEMRRGKWRGKYKQTRGKRGRKVYK